MFISECEKANSECSFISECIIVEGLKQVSVKSPCAEDNCLFISIDYFTKCFE